MTACHWPADAIALARARQPSAPVIRREALVHPLPGLDLWDYWPVQEADGSVAEIAGGALHMFLAAPVLPDPEERHAHARLRLLHRVGDRWTDLGWVLPDGLSPGSREWSGSAVVTPDHGRVTLHFTAAGRRGEIWTTFEQRLFQTTGILEVTEGSPRLRDWSPPVESIAPDGIHYMRDMAGGGGIGTIKAFRDPFRFRDPKNGVDHLLFTASMASSRSPWNGAIGVADLQGTTWRLMPPIIEADAVNNELERPHVVMHGGRYHCFWSTQRKVFAPNVSAGPTGLYGMAADDIHGPWTPLNGSGLVLANPPSAPDQAYSWMVLPDLTVLSFADAVGPGGRPADVAAARAAFGGCPAPETRIKIDGDVAGPG